MTRAWVSAYRLKIDISKLTTLALGRPGLGTKDAGSLQELWALGLMFWMYQRKTGREARSIQEKFAKKPELADANIRAFKAGYSYGENTGDVWPDLPRSSGQDRAGSVSYRDGKLGDGAGCGVRGSAGGVPVFFGGYPITPASDILHELSNYLNWNQRRRSRRKMRSRASDRRSAPSYSGSLGDGGDEWPGHLAQQEAVGLADAGAAAADHQRAARRAFDGSSHDQDGQADLLEARTSSRGPVPVAAMTRC